MCFEKRNAKSRNQKQERAYMYVYCMKRQNANYPENIMWCEMGK